MKAGGGKNCEHCRAEIWRQQETDWLQIVASAQAWQELPSLSQLCSALSWLGPSQPAATLRRVECDNPHTATIPHPHTATIALFRRWAAAREFWIFCSQKWHFSLWPASLRQAVGPSRIPTIRASNRLSRGPAEGWRCLTAAGIHSRSAALEPKGGWFSLPTDLVVNWRWSLPAIGCRH
jgi:hypothetical protein